MATRGIRVDSKQVERKLGRLPKKLVDNFRKTLEAEIPKAVGEVKRSLSQKWAPFSSSGRSGQAPLFRTGRLLESIDGEVRVKRSVVSGRFGVITRSPKINSYANMLEYGAPGRTASGERIPAITPKQGEWLTVFTDYVRRSDGTPIFKPKGRPDAPLTAARVKAAGFSSTYLEHKSPTKAYMWGHHVGAKRSVLIAVFLKKVEVEPRPYVGPVADRFFKAMTRSKARQAAAEAL